MCRLARCACIVKLTSAVHQRFLACPAWLPSSDMLRPKQLLTCKPLHMLRPKQLAEPTALALPLSAHICIAFGGECCHNGLLYPVDVPHVSSRSVCNALVHPKIIRGCHSCCAESDPCDLDASGHQTRSAGRLFRPNFDRGSKDHPRCSDCIKCSNAIPEPLPYAESCQGGGCSCCNRYI